VSKKAGTKAKEKPEMMEEEEMKEGWDGENRETSKPSYIGKPIQTQLRSPAPNKLL
jgi:hypothetical protein